MTSVPGSSRVITYTPAERHALGRLRRRHRQQEAVWSPRELAHLRFVRWLYLTRRLLPQAGDQGEARGDESNGPDTADHDGPPDTRRERETMKRKVKGAAI